MAEIPIQVRQQGAKAALRELNSLQRKLRGLNSQGSSGRVNRGIEGIGESAKSSQGGVSALSVAVGNIGATAVLAGIEAVGQGIAKIGEEAKKSVDTFANLDQQLKTFQAIQGVDESSKEFQAYREEVERLGATTTFTAAEVGELGVTLSRAGLDMNQVKNSLEATTDAAIASNTDLAETGEIITQVGNTFGGLEDGVKGFTDISDTLVFTANNAATTVSELGGSFKNVGPLAKQAGLDAKDASQFFDLFAQAGIRGGEAGTALRAMLNRTVPAIQGLKDGTDGLTRSQKRVAEQLQDLGYSYEDFVTSTGKLDPQKLVGNFSEIFRSFDTDVERSAFAIKTFMQEYGSKLIPVLNQSKGDIKALSTEYSNMAGTASETAGVMQTSLTAQFKKVGSAVDGLRIKIGESFAPALTELSQGSVGFFTSLTESLTESGAFKGISEFLLNLVTGFQSALDSINIEMFSGLFSQIGENMEFAGEVLANSGLEEKLLKLGRVISRLGGEGGANFQMIAESWQGAFRAIVNGVTVAVSALNELIEAAIDSGVVNLVFRTAQFIIARFAAKLNIAVGVIRLLIAGFRVLEPLIVPPLRVATDLIGWLLKGVSKLVVTFTNGFAQWSKSVDEIAKKIQTFLVGQLEGVVKVLNKIPGVNIQLPEVDLPTEKAEEGISDLAKSADEKLGNVGKKSGDSIDENLKSGLEDWSNETLESPLSVEGAALPKDDRDEGFTINTEGTSLEGKNMVASYEDRADAVNDLSDAENKATKNSIENEKKKQSVLEETSSVAEGEAEKEEKAKIESEEKVSSVAGQSTEEKLANKRKEQASIDETAKTAESAAEREKQAQAEAAREAEEARRRQQELIRKQKEAALDAVEEEFNAKERSLDEQNLKIEKQVQAADDVTLAFERQIEASDRVTDSLKVQTDLLKSQGEVQDSIFDLELSKKESRLEELKQREDVLGKLQDENLEAEERAALEAELEALGGKRGQSVTDALKARQKQENRIAEQRRDQLAAEFQREQKLLDLENQRNIQSAKRAVIEARIAENKAKQSSLKAEQDELKARQEIANAQEAIRKAKIEGDANALADAKLKLRVAKNELEVAQRGREIAAENIELAQQETQFQQQQVGVTQQLNAEEKKALTLQQRAKAIEEDREEINRRIGQGREKAEAGLEFGDIDPVKPLVEEVEQAQINVPQVGNQVQDSIKQVKVQADIDPNLDSTKLQKQADANPISASVKIEGQESQKQFAEFQQQAGLQQKQVLFEQSQVIARQNELMTVRIQLEAKLASIEARRIEREAEARLESKKSEVQALEEERQELLERRERSPERFGRTAGGQRLQEVDNLLKKEREELTTIQETAEQSKKDREILDSLAKQSQGLAETSQSRSSIQSDINEKQDSEVKKQQELLSLEQERIQNLQSLADSTASLGEVIPQVSGIEGIEGRRMGGTVESGTPYKVGESGEELFIPNTGGYILNNRRTRQFLGKIRDTNSLNIPSLKKEDPLIKEVKKLRKELKSVRGINQQNKFTTYLSHRDQVQQRDEIAQLQKSMLRGLRKI